MKKTNLYAIIAAAVTAVAAISIVGCNGDFGSSSEGMNGFLERFHYGTKKFTVTYYGNDNTSGTAPVDPKSPYDSGAAVKVLGEGTLVKDGYKFNRWNTQATGSGRNYSVDASFQISENVKLYAVWSRASTPTYNVEVTGSSQGTNVSGGGKYEAGAEVTIDAGSPPAGREFQGWTVISGGISFDNPNERSITFTMPPNDVKAMAVFTATAGATNWFKDDRDGKEYRTVTVGEQTWMAENLNYTPASGNSWCYDDDPGKCGTYGRLYDWATAMEVCPVGWHLPSREEWGELAIAAGGSGEYGEEGSAGTRLKAGPPNWDGTDEYGFAGLPGGSRNGSIFENDGIHGHWWMAMDAYIRHLYSGGDNVRELDVDKGRGFSVRCIEGNDGPGYATELGTPSGLTATATPYSITLKWSPARGGAIGYFVYSRTNLSTYTRLTVTSSTSYIHTGLAQSTTLYYKVSAYDNNGESSKYSEIQITTATITKILGKFTDKRDNKEYKTATIDGTRWMAENLNFTPASGNSWCYDDDMSKCDAYGRLYDWASAMNIDTMFNNMTWPGSTVKHQGVCPDGWHLPSRGEWGDLVTAVGGDGAGTNLKSTFGWDDYIFSGWNNSLNGNGTDDYGFSALPGGWWRSDGHGFWGISANGGWWTATDGNDGNAYGRAIASSYDGVEETRDGKHGRHSLRCVEND
jgi:uncharacterized protein (TIGR02145 family)